MNKKNIIPIILIIVIIVVILIFFIQKNNRKTNNSIKNLDNTVTNLESNNAKEDMRTIYIRINNRILGVELEDNSATKELTEKLENGDITIQANEEYGGFEKVGDLGFSLTREDKNITTTAGDIVLYQGNKISLFYNSNSWSYTKLGKIQNIGTNELKSILGSEDVVLTLTLSR